MSELCKIESPISLHLMSLNFEKKKKKGRKEERETEEESERMMEKGGRERMGALCTVLGKFTQHKSGCKCL